MKNLCFGLVVCFAFSATQTQAADEDRSWHLLQKQGDGLIRSVIHDMTKHECVFARARIMGLPATDAEIAAEQARVAKADAEAANAHEEWLSKHPECRGDVPGTTKCALLGSVKNSMISFESSNKSTDIRSAECFQ